MQKVNYQQKTSKQLGDPFYFEKLRCQYAKNNEIEKFKKLYSSKIPSIKNKNTGSLWDEYNFSRLGNLQKSPIYIDKISRILKELNKISGRILDIGFGAGELEKRMKNQKVLLSGLDISKKSVDRIKKVIQGNFKVGSVLKIPFENKIFDCVLALDILEHISPAKTFKALNEIRRVLKDDSIIVISIPLNENLEKMIKYDGINPNAHVRVYTPDILKAELSISGFEVKKEYSLYAFKNLYFLKNIIAKVLPTLFNPNLIIVIAKKL